jgi:hypothetical protein
MTLLAIGRRIGNPMSWCRREPTITEILSDSIIVAVMKADGVDPSALEAQLRGIAQNSPGVPHRARRLV